MKEGQQAPDQSPELGLPMVCNQDDCGETKVFPVSAIKSILHYVNAEGRAEALVVAEARNRIGCLHADCGKKICEAVITNLETINWLQGNAPPQVSAG